ncbi:exodeoxyribonuclease VII large subunit [Candidatus Saccharibacteria bacterium]|nr:exodeoxyribonuclease VII large subunit [Candidatus Saccharibacteria bacterium]
MLDQVYTPSDFIAIFNQTIEYAYPTVVVEGELANFRISKNRWVYFDLKDTVASVPYFGSVYQLPGPLSDGLMVRVIGTPRMHQLFGFSISFQSILPVGKGSLKKAADLLFKKMQKEGLFAPERKRPLTYPPTSVGLISAGSSAAYADFLKIINERWMGVEITHIDCLVQGEHAPEQLVSAIEHFNGLQTMPEVLVITRGGGSADDLAAFNDERVVRAVAFSRIPTLVAIGHEVDISLAELAADKRASTPSNAAQVLVPDRSHELSNLQMNRKKLEYLSVQFFEFQSSDLKIKKDNLGGYIKHWLFQESNRLVSVSKMLEIFNPNAALRRGYAIVSKGGMNVSSTQEVEVGDLLKVKLRNGTIRSKVTGLKKEKNA